MNTLPPFEVLHLSPKHLAYSISTFNGLVSVLEATAECEAS